MVLLQNRKKYLPDPEGVQSGSIPSKMQEVDPLCCVIFCLNFINLFADLQHFLIQRTDHRGTLLKLLIH